MRKKNIYLLLIALAIFLLASYESYDKSKRSFLEFVIVMGRYEKGKVLDPVITNSDLQWKKVMSDLEREKIIKYIIAVGKKKCPDIYQISIDKHNGTLDISDVFIKEIPYYHKAFYSGKIVILSSENYRIFDPTVFDASKILFIVTVINPVTLEQGTFKIITRELVILIQAVIIILFILFVGLSFYFFEDRSLFSMLLCIIISLIFLVLSWFYLCYLIVGILSIGFIIFIFGYYIYYI